MPRVNFNMYLFIKQLYVPEKRNEYMKLAINKILAITPKL